MYGWNEISLRKWNEIEDILSRKYEDDILKTAELIKVVIGIEDPMSLSPAEFQKHLHELEFLNTEIPEKKLLNVYTINGTKYVFHGNCFNISMSQLMDWRKFSTKSPLDYAECLSVFMIPEGHKYNDGYDMDKTMEDISCLPIGDVLKVWNFFVSGLILFTETLTDYFKCQLKRTSLTKEEKKEMMEKMERVQEIWDMTYSLMQSPMQK